MKWPLPVLLFGLGCSPGFVCLNAADPDYERLKGDALKEVLRPVPPKEPAQAIRLLEVIDGFSVEFVAHEPLVLDPVAAAIDENGLMYVAEDADYPYQPEKGELPKGRIRVLKDNDGDGFYEESHLFAEGLLWPAGVAPWKGGIFVTAPPDIWYLKDTDGDFAVDVREKVYSGFGTGGSQYILNNLQWGLDHKIYAAVAGNGGMVGRADTAGRNPVSLSRKDFRFDPVTKDFESISGGKQFGNTFDDWGNRFLCTQDTPVYQVLFPAHYLARNPLLTVPDTTPRLVPDSTPIYRTSPIEAWRAIRSSRRLLAQKGSPEGSGVSHHVLDGVAGVTVYRGGAFPPEFYGNVFCGDAQNNLVHRRSLTPDGVLFRSERLDQRTEFLRSKDNWFRPVNFVNAPDGTLYVLDLAREILEAVHIPMDVVAHLDLTSGRDRGRIYRVVPKGFKRPAQPRLSDFTTEQLVGCLESPHGWWRDTAHRLLYERQDKSGETRLRHLLEQSPRPQSRVHALWSLAGLNILADRDLLTGLADAHPAVRENAVRLAESRMNQSNEIFARCLELAADPDPRVRFQVAFTLGVSRDTRAARGLAILCRRDEADDFIRAAILSSSYNWAAALTGELIDDPISGQSSAGNQLLEELTRIVGGRNQMEEIMPVLSAVFGKNRSDLQPPIVIGLSDGLRNSGARLSASVKALDVPAIRRFHDLIQTMIQTIKDRDSDADSVKTALRLLDNAAADRAVPAIIGLLDRFPPARLQVAAIQTLSRLDGPGVEEVFLARWRTLAPEARREALSILLIKKERIDLLLNVIERGRISAGELDAVSRSVLLRHSDSSIRRRAAALWGAEKSGARNQIIQKYRPSLSLKGNPQAGQTTFQRLCSSCHRLSGIGNELGPNLALAASRSPDELLTHILDPNREVNPAYVQFTVETTDGESFSGLLVADQPASVALKGVNFQKIIPRQQIKKIASDGQSLMPVGLEQDLSSQDMADLLSFLIGSQYDFGTSGRSFSQDMPERR
jgi:putative membrane-bound dehydrogenase-like protein